MIALGVFLFWFVVFIIVDGAINEWDRTRK